MAAEPDAKGVALGIGGYAIWGIFPAFWPLLDPAGPIEVLAHRIAWTMVLMLGVVEVTRGWSTLRSLSLRTWLLVGAAAVLIAGNWGTFIYAVAIDHVVDVALGYYMGPLVSVLIGVLVLRERLRAVQWGAVSLALAAVVVITADTGTVPVIALVLAVTFAVYGLIKKTIPLSSTSSLAAEGLVLGPLALGFIVWLELTGRGTLTGFGFGHVLLLMAAGPVTAVPLLLFGAAARRIPLTTNGVLQYITPTMQLAWGVFVLGEAVSTARWIGFGLVWIALVVFTVDLLRHAHVARASGVAQPVRSTT